MVAEGHGVILYLKQEDCDQIPQLTITLGKNIPSHEQIQLLGLCAVILITCAAVSMVQIDGKIKDAEDKLKAQTAKQEYTMKTTARRADLDFVANEFSHLDADNKKLGLAQKGAKLDYIGIHDAEKDI
ncbi:UNVERIFIED_CONTAM: hypothetical protein HDU68_000533 [Siphonaria sp. JEL0065]|nr:hypothetical protein HDU68_000533 [Siphonaria sp. JEL0065]